MGRMRRWGRGRLSVFSPGGRATFVHGGVVVSPLDFFSPDFPKHTLKNFET